MSKRWPVMERKVSIPRMSEKDEKHQLWRAVKYMKMAKVITGDETRFYPYYFKAIKGEWKICKVKEKFPDWVEDMFTEGFHRIVTVTDVKRVG